MSTHSVTEVQDQLTELIDRALSGEAVVITRDGRPVAEITPVKPPKPPKRPMTPEELARIETNRVKLRGDVDPVALVSQMRDEDWP